MGNQSNVKALRKSLRNVVQDLLPTVLNAELSAAITKQLGEQLGLRMDVIAKNAKETLDKIDAGQRDFQNMMLRTLAPPAVPVEQVNLTETPPTETL